MVEIKVGLNKRGPPDTGDTNLNLGNFHLGTTLFMASKNSNACSIFQIIEEVFSWMQIGSTQFDCPKAK